MGCLQSVGYDSEDSPHAYSAGPAMPDTLLQSIEVLSAPAGTLASSSVRGKNSFTLVYSSGLKIMSVLFAGVPSGVTFY